VLTSPDAPVVTLLGDAVRRVTGREPVHAAMPSWTDAHSFAEAGSSVVVFGPGTLRYAHRPDEQIDVREIVTSARILADVLLRSRELQGQAVRSS
jgi:acetylornithine deacetylase/succinyl-diaminopimelate desuccinylase-like protein